MTEYVSAQDRAREWLERTGVGADYPTSQAKKLERSLVAVMREQAKQCARIIAQDIAFIEADSIESALGQACLAAYKANTI